MKFFKDVSTKSLESVGAFGQLNQKAWSSLAEKQMEIISLATEASVESLNVFSKTQDVKDLTEQQTKITKDFGEKLKVKNQELVDISTKVRDDFNEFTQKQVSLVNENLSNVAQ
ncbi:phasin family protein [Thalassotalea sp. ND16A]|uniref:phasin family protein n=1 Tax=Thalassotalea sp. ND16A TaxID=1535422 RepID=UPI001F471A78|nr:phasin family protein [Thalassotalea sp. ND16A]